MTVRSVSIHNFIHSGFKEFSLYDNVRSIPSITDGLKPSQRKALWGTVARGENAGEIQVERLASMISAVTDYHHGTKSMEGTVIGMATPYPGTNNMNLFIPSGQFGSRLTKEAGAGRYIMTELSPNFRLLFSKDDDLILEHNYTDGEKIEPKTFVPILPVVLINGSQGTGTGHASYIMNYNPKEIAKYVRAVIKGERQTPGTLKPWFNGFAGDVSRNPETGQVQIRGRLEIVNRNTIKITELPVGTFLDPYKEHLHKLVDEGFIRDFDDFSTEESFEFVVSVPRTTADLPHETLMHKFKLISRDTENYTLWNEKGTLEKFTSAEQIVERFVGWRLQKYEQRRQALIDAKNADLVWLNEKLRFILFYLDNTSQFRNAPKADLVQLLIENSFESYDRLLQMPMWNLTRDKIQELEKQIEDVKKAITALESTTGQQMYVADLNRIEDKLPG